MPRVPWPDADRSSQLLTLHRRTASAVSHAILSTDLQYQDVERAKAMSMYSLVARCVQKLLALVALGDASHRISSLATRVLIMLCEGQMPLFFQKNFGGRITKYPASQLAAIASIFLRLGTPLDLKRNADVLLRLSEEVRLRRPPPHGRQSLLTAPCRQSGPVSRLELPAALALVAPKPPLLSAAAIAATERRIARVARSGPLACRPRPQKGSLLGGWGLSLSLAGGGAPENVALEPDGTAARGEFTPLNVVPSTHCYDPAQLQAVQAYSSIYDWLYHVHGSFSPTEGGVPAWVFERERARRRMATAPVASAAGGEEAASPAPVAPLTAGHPPGAGPYLNAGLEAADDVTELSDDMADTAVALSQRMLVQVGGFPDVSVIRGGGEGCLHGAMRWTACPALIPCYRWQCSGSYPRQARARSSSRSASRRSSWRARLWRYACGTAPVGRKPGRDSLCPSLH